MPNPSKIEELGSLLSYRAGSIINLYIPQFMLFVKGFLKNRDMLMRHWYISHLHRQGDFPQSLLGHLAVALRDVYPDAPAT